MYDIAKKLRDAADEERRGVVSPGNAALMRQAAELIERLQDDNDCLATALRKERQKHEEDPH